MMPVQQVCNVMQIGRDTLYWYVQAELGGGAEKWDKERVCPHIATNNRLTASDTLEVRIANLVNSARM